MRNRFFLLLQLLPISVFLGAARWGGYTDAGWRMAIQLAGGLAVLELGVLVATRFSFDRLILGANLYLILGGIAAFFEIAALQTIYSSLREAGMFAWILAVGLGTTLRSPDGFVGSAHEDPKCVLRASIFLLVASVFALVGSFLLRGQVLLGGTLPFIALMLIRKLITDQVLRASD